MEKGKSETVGIPAPKFQTVIAEIEGTSPLVLNRFSEKARMQIRERQVEGMASKSKRPREPKDFQACYQAAIHRSVEGWFGIPAAAIRNAMISACRLVGFQMTRAKMAVFCLPDGFSEDGTPLVKITRGEPVYFESYTRNETGVVDLRARPMWREGWRALVRIRFDADMFATTDVLNLLHRAGQQVGIGEGRNDSKNSNGMGWGAFRIIEEGESGGREAASN